MNGEKAQKRVFISYARDDGEYARRLFADLKNVGFDPWLDEENLLPGQKWKPQIDKAIRESNFFLALLSSNSVNKKGFAQHELLRALDELEKYPESQIFLIPVRLDECQPSNSSLLALNRADLFPSYEAGFEKLLRALRQGQLNGTEDRTGELVSVAGAESLGNDLDAAISPSEPEVEIAIESAALPGEVLPVVPQIRRTRRALAGLGLISLLAGLGGQRHISERKSGGVSQSPPSITVEQKEPRQGGESLLEYLRGLNFPAQVPLDVGGTDLDLVLIPRGSFLMGTPPTESDREPDEAQHRVEISRPFYIGKYEVTQKQFAKVMIGVFHLNQFDGRDQNPVENVSWSEANEFCRRLSTKLKGSIRLPTEAEWEYACRGPSTTFDEGRKMEQLAKIAWYSDNAGFETHPVGGKAPTGWGLYDMHGNVKEWCQDWYSEILDTRQAVDPQGPPAGIKRISRGGGIDSARGSCRSGYRGSADPGRRNHDRGFRIVVSLREPAELP